MAKLHEDVLRLIFDYLETPLEWIQVSEVCQLWKLASSKHWRKISKINYLKNDLEKKLKPEEIENAPMISTNDLKRILKCAAPFLKVLNASAVVYEEEEQLILFGSFLYKVRNFNPDATLFLLAQNASNVIKIVFDKPPKPKLLQLLIDTNEIKKVKFNKCGAFYEDVSTDEIEELSLRFNNTDEILSFSGHFPNLKKLDLKVNCKKPKELQQLLSTILSYVTGLKSFCLRATSHHPVSCKVFLPIAKFSQLENLTLHFSDTNIVAANFFLKKLDKGCPKLRSVKFVGIAVSEKQFRALLILPNLESLSVERVTHFKSMDLPESSNLSELKMEYNCALFNVSNFCNVLKKMPKLKFLEMRTDILAHSLSFRSYNDGDTLNLVCQVAIVAASQNKNIVVVKNQYRNSKSEKLLVAKQNVDSSEMEVLTVDIMTYFNDEIPFFERVKTFARNSLETYCVVVVE